MARYLGGGIPVSQIVDAFDAWYESQPRDVQEMVDIHLLNLLERNGMGIKGAKELLVRTYLCVDKAEVRDSA